MTHYNYRKITVRHHENGEGYSSVSSPSEDFLVDYGQMKGEASLPAGSPFASWKEARRFAGPLPFTFTYLPKEEKVMIVEGVRQGWSPQPVNIHRWTLPLVAPAGLGTSHFGQRLSRYQRTLSLEKGKERIMEAVRTPLQGVGNVVRFNYHFFILAFTGVVLVFGLSTVCKDTLSQLLVALGWLILLATWASLLASAWIYDWSEMYSFRWLGLEKSPDEINSVMNIHAGFDDTSQHLREVFPKANLSVYDFYDPVRHTEPSIARARKVYPPYPGTIKLTPPSQSS
jgi:hypothetical protein